MSHGKASSSRRVWLGFFAMIVLLALFASFALLRGGKQLAEMQVQQQAAPVQALLYVILNGEQRVIPEAKRLQLSLDMQDAVDAERKMLHQQLQQQIDAAVDAAFAPVHGHVEAFADWYYSLTGEYMRYAHAVGGDMADYLEQRLRETVFLPAALDVNLEAMLVDLNDRLLRGMQESGGRLAAQLQLFVSANSWSPGAGGSVAGDSLNLDQLFVSNLQPSTADINRQVFATLAATGTGAALAKGMGAAVVKKTVAEIAATKSFHAASALLAKLATKSAVKGGGALAGAGAGAAICSPAGPGALVCGAIGGLVAWVAIDKAVIELDEALNREGFENDIHAAITIQQEQLKASLQQVYAKVLDERFLLLEKNAQALAVPAGEFIPADLLLHPANEADYETQAVSPVK
ncbi:hypothetical protein [Thiolapillus sp.]